MSPSCRLTCTVLALAGSCVLPSLAAAADHAPQAAPPASAAASKAVTPPKFGKAPVDPLDQLRERLAERLGATRPQDAKAAQVMRVVARTERGHATPVVLSRSAATSGAVAPARAAAQTGHAGADAAPAQAHAAHWAYEGSSGPESWGRLKPEFVACSSGQRQSPIDIRDGIKVDLEPIQFDYRPTGFAVVDNGHTVQVNLGPGNAIEVAGRRFELVQFHFHRPAEERIDGRAFDMVAHLVHKDLDGRLAVVAVLLERGSAQPLVQTVWNNLPLEKGDEMRPRGALDLNQLLPQDRRYYTYMGSLTTPPCSEGVLWMVMAQPVAVSPEQIAVFSRLYPMNARPIQSAAGRLIKQSN